MEVHADGVGGLARVAPTSRAGRFVCSRVRAGYCSSRSWALFGSPPPRFVRHEDDVVQVATEEVQRE